LIGIARPALLPLLIALRQCQNRFKNQWVVCHLIYALGQVALGLDAGARLFWANTIESDMAAMAFGPAHALAPRVIELLRQGDGPPIGTECAVGSSAIAQVYKKLLASRKRPKPKKEVDPRVRELAKTLTARNEEKRRAALAEARAIESATFMQQLTTHLVDLLAESRSLAIRHRAFAALYWIGQAAVQSLRTYLSRSQSSRMPFLLVDVLNLIGGQLNAQDQLEMAGFFETVVKTKWPGQEHERLKRMINMLRLGRQLTSPPYGHRILGIWAAATALPQRRSKSRVRGRHTSDRNDKPSAGVEGLS
jgi:hypothetical protein